MRIFISGSIARDIIMDFSGRFRDHVNPKKIHVLSLSFAVENLQENYGGTAANICYNLALLAEKPSILGRLGREGREIKLHLAKLGVNTKYLGISGSHRTATAYIITDRDDNQISGFHAGAMNEAVKLPRVNKGDWAIIAAENTRNMVKLAKYYAKRGVNYIFDPGQQITALTNSDLQAAIKGARVLIGNDYEVANISKRIKIRVPVLVKTLGPKGSEIITGSRKIRIGIARPRRVVDPTGAGDAYRAGFLKGLILGYDLRQCGQLGATVASFAVEEYGTQNHRFTPEGVTKRMKTNFNI